MAALVRRGGLGDAIVPPVRLPFDHDFPAVGVGQVDGRYLCVAGQQWRHQRVEACDIIEPNAPGLAPRTCRAQLRFEAVEAPFGLRLDVPGAQIELYAGEGLGGRGDNQKMEGGAENEQTGDEGRGHAPQQAAG